MSGKVALIHRVVYVLAYLRNNSVVDDLLRVVHMLACLLNSSVFDEFAQNCTHPGMPAAGFIPWWICSLQHADLHLVQ